MLKGTYCHGIKKKCAYTFMYTVSVYVYVCILSISYYYVYYAYPTTSLNFLNKHTTR